MLAKRIGNHTMPLPSKATPESAGFDLRARLPADGVTLPPGCRALVPTGFAMAIPAGWAGLVCPRSGLALKAGLTVLNSPGIIDADYRGEVGVILFNASGTPVTIEHGDRIAQLVLSRILITGITEVEELDDTVRGDGGFGSSGVD